MNGDVVLKSHSALKVVTNTDKLKRNLFENVLFGGGNGMVPECKVLGVYTLPTRSQGSR